MADSVLSGTGVCGRSITGIGLAGGIGRESLSTVYSDRGKYAG